MAYVTVEEVAAYFGEDPEDALVEARLEMLIELSDDAIDTYCNTTFEYTGGSDVSYYLDGSGTDLLMLNPYISDLTSVKVMSSTGDEVADLTDFVGLFPSVDAFAQKYGVWKALRMHDQTSVFPLGNRNIKVTGKFGFETIPAAIKHASYLNIKYLKDQSIHNELVFMDKGVDRNLHMQKVRDTDFMSPMAKSILNKLKYIQADW